MTRSKSQLWVRDDPCPWCGVVFEPAHSHAHRVVEQLTTHTTYGPRIGTRTIKKPRFAVECGNCGLRTPWESSRLNAISGWRHMRAFMHPVPTPATSGAGAR